MGVIGVWSSVAGIPHGGRSIPTKLVGIKE